MKKIFAFIALILLLAGCAATPPKKASSADKPFFDAAKVESFLPGKTTRDEIYKAMGEPYPDPLKSDERWTYMYTYQKQIIFIFKDGILTEKRWSEEYGIGGK